MQNIRDNNCRIDNDLLLSRVNSRESADGSVWLSTHYCYKFLRADRAQKILTDYALADNAGIYVGNYSVKPVTRDVLESINAELKNLKIERALTIHHAYLRVNRVTAGRLWQYSNAGTHRNLHDVLAIQPAALHQRFNIELALETLRDPQALVSYEHGKKAVQFIDIHIKDQAARQKLAAAAAGNL